MLPTLILYRNGETKEQLVAWDANILDYHAIRSSSSRRVQQVPIRARMSVFVPTPEFSVQEVPHGAHHALEFMRFMTVEPNNHRAWRLDVGKTVVDEHGL